MLLARLRLQLEMTRALRSQMPNDLQDGFWCTRIRESILTVSVKDTSQAPLIHYRQRDLLEHVNTLFKEKLGQPLERIQIQVAAHRLGG